MFVLHFKKREKTSTISSRVSLTHTENHANTLISPSHLFDNCLRESSCLNVTLFDPQLLIFSSYSPFQPTSAVKFRLVLQLLLLPSSEVANHTRISVLYLPGILLRGETKNHYLLFFFKASALQSLNDLSVILIISAKFLKRADLFNVFNKQQTDLLAGFSDLNMRMFVIFRINQHFHGCGLLFGQSKRSQ